MTRDNPVSRRSALKLTGAAAATALVAGCSDNGDGNGNGDDDGNGDDGGNGADGGVEIEPGTTIELFGDSTGWEGIAPGEIDGEENPTLVLEDGEDYEIGWPEGDGARHNIEIRDDGGDVVEDYQTDEVQEEEPDDQFIEFTASDEMAEYVCAPHDGQMAGEIQVE